MSLILPPPILPHHPPPHWCDRCGQLENAGCNHPRGASGPPPLPKGRLWAAARRRRHALVALTRITGGVR